jgi:hypothetical protein
MKRGMVLIACLAICLGAIRANWVQAEELTKEEVAALKDLLKTKDTSPEGQLSTEDVGALKELLHAYKDGAGEAPAEITVPHMAKVEPLTDDEVTGIREFMTQFKGIKFTGFVENFYQYNTVDPGHAGGGVGVGSGRRGLIPSGIPGRNLLEIRAFDREDNSFTLNNIELHLYKEPTEDSPIGFRITTNYGEQAQRITFIPVDGRVDDDDFTVSEGYTWWKIPLGKGIDFKFGKFATWIGAEVWEAHWNPNWSRSLLYNNAIPFTNTGVVLGYPFLDNLYGAAFLVNGWDTFVDNNKGKTFGFQVKYTLPDLPILHNSFVVLNTSHGPEQSVKALAAVGIDAIPFTADDVFTTNSGGEGNWRHFFDLIFQFDPTSWLRMNTNVDFGTEQFERGFAGGYGTTVDVGDNRLNRKWWGVAQIFHLFPAKRINLALRGEYFWDKDAARNVVFPPLGDPTADTIAGVAIAEFTATCNIKIREKLWIRPEVRYDKITSAPGGTSSELFDNHDKNVSIATALTYEF